MHHCIGHGTVVVGANDTTFAIRFYMACSPDNRGAHIKCKDGIISSQFIETIYEILRVNCYTILFCNSIAVQIIAEFSVCFTNGIDEFCIIALCKMRK